MGFDYRRDASGIVIVTIDMDGQSANTMSQVYHQLMGDTVARLESEPGLAGVVFTSAKKTFFAGGDLHGLMQSAGGDVAYQDWLNEDKGYLRRLEHLPVPVVAAINGAALGGGFEICLACNHRIVVDDPGAVVGLPEVTLGLLPGAGGVVRLPRMVPMAQALDLLLSGRFVAPPEALELGLVDQIVPTRDDLLPAALKWISSAQARAVQPWDNAAEPLAPREADLALIAETRVRVMAQTRGKLPAPPAILDIVEQALALDLDQALLLETRTFAGLLGRPETRASIWLNFFAANAIRSGKRRPEGARHRTNALAILGSTDAAEALARAAARKMDLRRDTQAPVDMVLCFDGQGAGTAEAVGAEVRAAAPNHGADFGFRIAPETRLVELMAGTESAPDRLARAYDLFQRLGYTPIVVKDVAGHYVARLRAAYAAEAVALRDDMTELQIAAVAHDAGMTLTPAQALADPNVRALLPDAADWADTGMADAPGTDDATDRLLFAPAIAALGALGEGIVACEEEADVASVLGAGYPPHTGGAIRFIREIGPEAFAARAADLASRHGPRFTVAQTALEYLRGMRATP